MGALSSPTAKRKEPILSPRVQSPASSRSVKAKSSHETNGEDGFETVLTREEKRKLRKINKVEKAKPQFQYLTDYFNSGRKVGIAHIRELILYLVADGRKGDWILAQNKFAVAHTVCLLVPGLLPEHLGIPTPSINQNFPVPTANNVNFESGEKKESQVPVMQTLFTNACPTRAPGDARRMYSVLNTLMQCPLSDEERRKREAKSRQLAALAKEESSSPLPYLLTPNQMLDNDYPLPSYLEPSDNRPLPIHGLDEGSAGLSSASLHANGGSLNQNGDSSLAGPSRNGLNGKLSLKPASNVGWRETPEASGHTPDDFYPILAVDCEMVVTHLGQELARVSVIDFQSNVNVFDHFVKIDRPITDYRTQWSGITPEKLRSATHTLESIQSALLDGSDPIIKPNTILLGHSLECDLTALKIRHPYCIDTALMFKHPRGPPYKPGLKWLTKKWKGKDIQDNEKGHDSEEDARACVDLLKLKMANGPDFGTFLDNTESIFERISRYKDSETKISKTSAYCDVNSGRSSIVAKATTLRGCSNDDEVIDAMSDEIPKHNFTFGRLMGLSSALGWNGDKDFVTSDDKSSPDPDAIQNALSTLNGQITRLHASLPHNTALIILTGQSNPVPMLKLAAKRARWERLVKLVGGVEEIPVGERWMSEDDRELEARAAEAREGLSLFCVRNRPKDEIK